MVSEDLRARLRSQGHRLTPSELVLDAVERLGHATPEQVLVAVRETSHAVNISTVYRTLDLLEELGLVRHAHLSDRSPTYHPAAEPAHVHLVCRTCGRVSEVSPPVVEPLLAALERDHHFAVDVGHLTVFGSCTRHRREDAEAVTGTLAAE